MEAVREIGDCTAGAGPVAIDGSFAELVGAFTGLHAAVPSGGGEGAYVAMVKDWLPAALNRQDVIMLAPLRVDVAELNQRARHTLIECRKVDPWQSGEPFAPGDRIVTLTNDPRSGLINGERGIVTRVGARTGDLQVQFDTGLVAPRSAPHTSTPAVSTPATR